MLCCIVCYFTMTYLILNYQNTICYSTPNFTYSSLSLSICIYIYTFIYSTHYVLPKHTISCFLISHYIVLWYIVFFIPHHIVLHHNISYNRSYHIILIYHITSRFVMLLVPVQFYYNIPSLLAGATTRLFLTGAQQPHHFLSITGRAESRKPYNLNVPETLKP